MKNIIFCTVFSLIVGILCADDEANLTSNIGGLICGPQSVRHVLRFYQKEVDIVELIREMQYPEIKKGSSFLSVRDALENRSVHTFAMRIKPSAKIVWQYPVIVYFSPPQEEALGHFVVWFPASKGNEVSILDGDEGVRTFDERQWSQKHSGIILLTSPNPITNPSGALQWAPHDFWYPVFIWTFFIGSIGWMFVVFRWILFAPYRVTYKKWKY